MTSGAPAAVDLDDPAALSAGDPGEMLAAVASSAAQVREAAVRAGEAGLEQLADSARPRAVVCAGMGGSGIAGDVLAAVAGPGCPVPVWCHKSYGLPGWVGAADAVVAVSCSGTTEETLSALDEAARRGARVVAVGAAGSPLHLRAAQAGAPFVAVPGGRQPRASLWALAVPVLYIGGALGLMALPAPEVEAAALRLEAIAVACRVGSESFINPAKGLALALAGTLPMIWGSSALAGVAATRWSCQLNENAKLPAVSGVLPEANHNQVVTLDGPFARERDLFADPDGQLRIRLVVLRDPAGEHPQVTRRVEASRQLAADRGVAVSEVQAEGSSRLERLAHLIGIGDFASVYLALMGGVDPTPVAVISELKARIAT
ncbi:MAG: bifunctional phosphoglucose/phosphomannose isomerase [Mycobacteriales bacterium]